jgi:hypothetical protein
LKILDCLKKILYICDQSPFESTYGAQQRTSLLCDALCDNGQVDLVCFSSEAQRQTISKPNCTIKHFCELPTTVHKRKSQRLTKLLNLLLSFSPYSVYNKNKEACKIANNLLKFNHYDYIVVRYIKNAFICGLFNEKHLIVDVDDLPEQTIMSYADTVKLSKLKYFQYIFYANRAKFHTNNFLKRINHSFFPNEDQCHWKNSSYLPNIPYPDQRREQYLINVYSTDNESVVLFVGFMYHSPNLNGVSYFIENIWHKLNKLFLMLFLKLLVMELLQNRKLNLRSMKELRS